MGDVSDERLWAFCDSDPDAVQALKDLHCSECPLKQLMSIEKDSKVSKDIDDLLEKVEEVSNFSQRTKSPLQPQDVEDNFRKKVMVGYIENKVKENEPDPACQRNIIKLCSLVWLFDHLRKDNSTRRASAYKRIPTRGPSPHRPSRLEQIKIVVRPCLLFILCFSFQSLMLHLGTHYYIFYMETGDAHRQSEGGQLFDLVGDSVAHDLPREYVVNGKVQIPTILLDASGLIPFILCLASYMSAWYWNSFSIGLWVKTFLVASCMALLKGVADVITIMPDSSGWASCKERLGEVGLDQLRTMDFKHNFVSTLVATMWHEVEGGDNLRRVRYCADMMISGHTYFAAVFSLSAYKQVKHNTTTFPAGRCNKWIRDVVLTICILCLLTEIFLVALARFHYTVDMLMAVVLAVLLFDSTYVDQLCSDWSRGFYWKGSDGDVVDSQDASLLNLRSLQGLPPWTYRDGHEFPHENTLAEHPRQREAQPRNDSETSPFIDENAPAR